MARVATLRQAASVGGVAAVGEDTAQGSIEKPAWYRLECVVRTMDARPLPEAGEKPISAVLKGLGE
ncbi:MAG: hypothetical protein EHM18_09665 [Acidobacteria bacterium]|nr:MAG: hypothetical protein EHM18_09665 [Acidobacteriota bacterium]